MPWETGSGEGKYQYYPGGDRSATPKDAPSAVNVVVVPDVNLPKVRILFILLTRGAEGHKGGLCATGHRHLLPG